MMEHATDRLFWTLTTIIITALILTIGVNTFPKMTQNVISPISGVIKQADHVANTADATGNLAAKNASNFDLSSLNTNSDDQAKATAIDADKLGFKLSDTGNNTAMIVSYNNTSKNPVIPAYMKLNGQTVKITAIGGGAFSAMKLTSVSLPDTITTIWDWAFQNNQLTDITIPNSVTYIGTWAFQDNQLTNVSFPNSLTHIGNLSFSMNQLQSVHIPDAVTYVGDWSFQNNKINDLSIGKAVNYIGPYAFSMNNFKSVNLPNSVKTLGDNAFDSSINVIHNHS